MKKYTFYVDKDNKLNCNIINDDNKKHFVGESAIKVLKKLDELDFKKVKVMDDRIFLSNKKQEVIFRTLEKFAKLNYMSFFKKNYELVEKAFIEYQRKKHSNENVVNRKINSRAIVKSTAFLLLVAGISLSKTSSLAMESEVPIIEISYEQIPDDELDLEEIIDSETYIDIDVEKELEEELEEIDGVIIDEVVYVEQAKIDNVEENFSDIIEKYSSKWGISSNLCEACIVQESGGFEKNLMQIQFDSWKDMPLSGYNHIDNAVQTIVLTDDFSKYDGKGYTCISRNELLNPVTNISVGSLILNKSIEYMNGHIGAGIQCFNFGIGNMQKVMNATSQATGLSIDELLSDQTNMEFRNYTNVVSVGDSSYFINVAKHAEGEFNVIIPTGDNHFSNYSVNVNFENRIYK